VTYSTDDIEWRIAPAPVAYEAAVAEMEARAAAVVAGTACELVWLLEHPPVKTGRGGRYTYHGPGQRIGYVVLDLDKRGRDVRHFVHALEGWVIAALADIGIAAFRAPGRIGIWTMAPVPGGGAVEAKIGAIGVRVRRWVTLHGFSVNLSPDLSHFGGIVPCGIAEYPVTSSESLGKSADLATFDAALAAAFPAFLQTLSSPR